MKGVNCYLCFMLKALNKILVTIFSLPVYFYKYAISPLLRPSCRHVPSCSQYTLDALKIYGPLTGSLLALNRILRCRPGGTHGYDPVPLFRFKKYTLFRHYKKCNRLK
jgi:putative membrane protein insertion efficiency factor